MIKCGDLEKGNFSESPYKKESYNAIYVKMPIWLE